jgi:transposase
MKYPIEFRQKVLAMKKKHKWTFEKTSKHFEIGIRTIFRWDKNVESKERTKEQKTKIKKEDLIRDVEEYPDAYGYERASRLNVTQSGICRALKRLNISYKKKSKSC